MNKNIELKITGGTDFEKATVWEYLIDRFEEKATGIRVKDEWIVYVHVESKEDENMLYKSVQCLPDGINIKIGEII